MRHYILILQEIEFIRRASFNDVTELTQALGEDSLQMLWPVICEFFYSNVYGNDGKWNVVDEFLETARGRRLSKKDKLYLKHSQESIFSIYEIISVDKDKSLTLKDIIRNTEAVTVSEKSATPIDLNI